MSEAEKTSLNAANGQITTLKATLDKELTKVRQLEAHLRTERETSSLYTNLSAGIMGVVVNHIHHLGPAIETWRAGEILSRQWLEGDGPGPADIVEFDNGRFLFAAIDDAFSRKFSNTDVEMPHTPPLPSTSTTPPDPIARRSVRDSLRSIYIHMLFQQDRLATGLGLVAIPLNRLVHGRTNLSEAKFWTLSTHKAWKKKIEEYFGVLSRVVCVVGRIR